MTISTRGRYALRMMVDLAENQGDGYLALKDIAERQNISKKYLEQIIPILNRANLLRTVRGNQGGYRLEKHPSAYTVGDILRATEGSLAPVACLESKTNTCERRSGCATLFVWEGLDKAINEYLDSITLQDIVDRHQTTDGGDYII